KGGTAPVETGRVEKGERSRPGQRAARSRVQSQGLPAQKRRSRDRKDRDRRGQDGRVDRAPEPQPEADGDLSERAAEEAVEEDRLAVAGAKGLAAVHAADGVEEYRGRHDAKSREDQGRDQPEGELAENRKEREARLRTCQREMDLPGARAPMGH